MLYPAVLCAASGMIALIREEYWLAAGAAALAIGCIVFCVVLHRKRKRNEAVMNAILDIRSKQEKPDGGSLDTAFDFLSAGKVKLKKRPCPDPDCPKKDD